jgi:ankyrin repeat protein
VNARDKYEWTPLYRAAYNGHVEAVKTLLELGADRTLRDEKVGF